MNLKLRQVSKRDYKFLYALLAQRNPNESMSHRKMPTWEKHVRFNDNKPYETDYIIYLNNKPVGRFYITSTFCVGIKVMNNVRERVIEEILQTIPYDFRCFFHVSPKDKVFKNILKRFKFKKFQETYENIP